MIAVEVELQVNGMGLHGRWWGDRAPGRPVLVFLHDGLGCCAGWRDFPSRLTGLTGLAGFAYDRPGHGGSAPRAGFGPGLLEEEAVRLGVVLTAACIGDHIVIGHSDGATIGLLHAAADPAGLSAMVSLAAHVHGDEAAARHVARHHHLAAAGRVPGWLTSLHGAKGKALAAGWSSVWGRAFDEGWDMAAALGTITVPVLALQGAEDPCGLPGQLAAIADRVTGAETHLLPGLGHDLHHQDAAGVARLINAFVARLPSGGTDRTAG